MMSSWVIAWSAALSVIAVVNVVAWAMSAVALRRGRDQLAAHVLRFRQLQLLLSAGYVMGCAFRSALPVFDVPRVTLINSVLSTAAVGRSIATVAELCFVAQWALLLRETSRATGTVVASLASRSVIPMIVVAELCSWYSVLSTSNLGHVFEESLWSAATVLVVAGLLADRQGGGVRWRTASAWLAIGGIGYFVYLVSVDVPMYWSRWIADQLSGKPYLSFGQGWLNASGPHAVSYAWNIWKSEMAWMAIYFSVAVWVSIWLVHAPVPFSRFPVPRPAHVASNGFGPFERRRLRF